MIYPVVLGLVFCILGSSAAKVNLSCLGEQGESLDWYTVYKLPKGNAQNSSKFLSIGTAHMFITNLKQKWTMSNLSLTDQNSMNGKTLNSIYYSKKNDPDCWRIVYNDQYNGGSSDSRGHTKGSIFGCGENFVHIVHSFPNHPIPDRYFLNTSQSVFGQSLMCATFKNDQLLKLLTQVGYEFPGVYDSSIPASTNWYLGVKEIVLLKALAKGKRTTKNLTMTSNLVTSGGEEIVYMSKSSFYRPDLYLGVLAEYWNNTFAVETWRIGNGGLYPKYQLFNCFI